MKDNHRNLALWGIEHSSLLIYLIIVMLITGSVAFFQLGQRDLPVFAIKTMVVSAKWPGASAEEMSQFVTDPIETKLLEVPWLKDVTSFSKPGETWLLVNTEDFMPDGKKLMKDRFYDVRKKLGDIAHQLPANVQGPFFNDEFGDIYSMMYSFNSDTYSFAELKDYTEKARNALIRIESVEKAVLYGVQEEKIFVEIDDKRIAALGIDPLHVANLLRSHNALQNNGQIEGQQAYYRLYLNDRFQSVQDIAQMPVGSHEQRVIYLEDIARVYHGYEDPPHFRMRANGKPSIGLAITMRDGSQLLTMSEQVREVMAGFIDNLPLGIDVALIADQPESVRDSVNRFLIKLAIAVFIVLVVCYFSLGLRTGLIVALAIPMVLGTVSVLMYLLKIDLTRVSLGALVIALGLLVDDAMIVVELMHVKLEQGWDRLKAATFAYTSTSMPMLSGTLIAAAGFLPVFIVSASPRDILGDLFVVISSALISSWIIAVLFTPYLSYKLLKNGANGDTEASSSTTNPNAVYQTLNYQRFRKLVAWCMSHSFRVIAAILLTFGLTVVGLQGVKMQFFPDNDRSEVLVDIWFPEGTAYQYMEKKIGGIESQLATDDDAKDYVAYVGGDILRVQNDMYVEQPNANYSKISIVAKDFPARERLKSRLRNYLTNHLPGVRTRVYSLPYGLPFSYPVQYLITGDDPEQLGKISAQLTALLKNHPATREVHDNRREQRLGINITLDLPRLAALGGNPALLAQSLSSMLDGIPVTNYRDGNDLIAVVIRNYAENRQNINTLGSLQIPIGNGKTAPLSELAKIDYRFDDSVIWRYNGYRAITVQALLAGDIQNFQLDKEIGKELNELRASLPGGYVIKAVGEVEISQMVDKQLAKTLPVVVVVILTLLMLQLNSIKKMVLVLMTVPLGLIGVVSILLAMDLPFGLVARLGVLALAGIIIRNTIILVDQIDQDLASGLSPWDAVLESTVRRARPIVLTALAAILAMIPLANDYFWGPMAVAMMNGLFVATLLTLLVFPAMYVAWYRINPPAEVV
jgi:multidrug efflux pump